MKQKTGSVIFVAFVAALLGLSFLAVSGCNTVEGAGEDIEAVGDSIQDAAD